MRDNQPNEEFDRKIFIHEADPDLPAVVLIGGIHGNEKSGTLALLDICKQIEEDKIQLSGSLYVLNGNLSALKAEQRFMDADLNRLWTVENVKAFKTGNGPNWGEEREQFADLLHEIERIIDRFDHTIVFSDLHTTSSPSCPFIPINDTIANRELARKFPLPTVLGIEEFIDGPLLSYINEIGHVALGFEGGQHDNPSAVEIHKSFCWLLLHHTGIISSLAPEFIAAQEQTLRRATSELHGFYEVRSLHSIQANEKFEMLPGFSTFQRVKKGQELAISNGERLSAPETGRVFMPLYQDQGEDGFYIVRDINPFWLWASKWLRRLRLDALLILLPGIRRHPDIPYSLLAKRGPSTKWSKRVFHLFGYRVKTRKENQWVMTRREVSRLRHFSS